MKSTILVLLAACNGEKWLKKQVDIIFCQLNVNVRVVISIDASTDKTIECVHQLKSLYPSLELLSQNVVLGGAAKNFFYLLREVNLAGVDYVALSDQDDIWFVDKLKRAIEKMDMNRVAAYSSNVNAFWENGKTLLINKAQPQTAFDFMFESAGPGCTFVLHRDLATDIQDFLKKHKHQSDQIALHDWFIYAYARSKHYNWYIDPEPTMLYRQHENNVIGANRGLKPMLARLNKIRHGWYDSQIKLIAQTLGYQHTWPIQLLIRLTFKDRLTLALHARQFRRRLRDQIAFAIYVLLLAKK
jgi:rhamnosyltransferase